MPNLARGFREWIDRASAGTPGDYKSDTAMPNLGRGVWELIERAAGATDLTPKADPGRSSPDPVVPVESADPAVGVQTDTAESHGTPAINTESAPPRRIADGIEESDICAFVKGRIQRNVSDLVHRKCPNPLMPYVLFRDASLSDWFETELFNILERGGRDLVRSEVETASQRSGGGLSCVEIETISASTFTSLEKLWNNAGRFDETQLLLRDSTIKSTLLRLENAVHDEAQAAARDLTNAKQLGKLRASTIAEESRSAAPTEIGNTLSRGSYFQGLAEGAMDKPDSINPVERFLGVRVPEFARFIQAVQNPEKADSGQKAIYALIGTLYPIGGESIIAKLPQVAFLRMEAETAAFLADYLPRLEREANRSGPIHDAELVRELVIHRFSLVARECLAVCTSVEEFVAELRWNIARFVCYGLSQYGWVTDPMVRELDLGFTFFVTGAKPWATVREADRDSVLAYSGHYADFAAVANRTGLHVGAITAEALSHLALKLIAEATARAVESQNTVRSTEPATESEISVPEFQNRAKWLEARLSERGWSKHDLHRSGGPEHRTTQKILDGGAVQEDVLRKVILGLQSKQTHKGRTLPKVAESDIPND